MALSLTAEQKSLMELFTTRDKYIIPSYQRPYSWEYEQCLKLYSDIIDAYDNKNDYFLGNVIISRSMRDAQRPQIVDGQQRILTLWIAFKALSVLLPDINVLQEVTTVRSWDGNTHEVKVSSDVFESEDQEDIKKVASFSCEEFEEYLGRARNAQGDIRPNYYKSKIVTNSLYFYSWFSDYLKEYGREAVMNYLQFLLQRVSLLPIELVGNDQKDADDKALTIFETINNRGRDLTDADIFKAKLYGKAITKEDQKEFINLWVEFKTTCDQQNLSIDDAFRFYSHVVRGEQGITGTEKSLRDFFIEDSKSPLNHKGFRDVMADLMHVLEVLRDIAIEGEQSTRLAAWIQLIVAYSNVYPMYSLFTYAYKYGIKDNEEQTIQYLSSVVRYCYYQGSTTMVKFEIYNIIRQMFIKLPIKAYYQKSIDENYFNNLGRLKYSYALLAHYLQEPKALKGYNIDKILSSRDVRQLDPSWEGIDFYDHVDDLGNFIVLDVNKQNRSYQDKRVFYEKSNIASVKEFIDKHKTITFKDIQERTIALKTVLNDFFREPQN